MKSRKVIIPSVVLYDYRSFSTARQLLEAMRERYPNDRWIMRKEYPFAADKVIRWGNSYAEVKSFNRQFNSIQAVKDASDKLAMSEKIESIVGENWCSIPFYRDQNPYAFADGDDLTRQFHAFIRYEDGHVKYVNNGSVFEFQRQMAKMLYASPVIPKVREFRVHVFCGKVLGVYEKVLESQEGVTDISTVLMKSDKCGFRRLDMADKTTRNSLKGLRPAAVEAVRRIGLDSGGVDVMMTADNMFYVNEVNSAPSLNDTNIERYANRISEFFDAPGELEETQGQD